MGNDSRRATKRRGSIRAYVAVWVGSILVSCLVLAVALYAATRRLQRMTGRILVDANAIEAGRLLETALLDGRREDLLWRATASAEHRARAVTELREAERVADGLRVYVTSSEEGLSVAEIQAKLGELRAESSADAAPPLADVRERAEGLLAAVRRFVQQNQSQLEETVRAARQLHASLEHWSLGLVLVVAVLLAGGSLGLVGRIVRPTLELTRAAHRFGRGDYAARTRVRHDDELGELCRTFNDMAEDIQDQEKLRLEFVACVAHDLKSPLVTIGGAARRVAKLAGQPDRQDEWLGRITVQVARLEKLTQDLMDTVQVSTGRLTLNEEQLDLTALIRGLQSEQAEFFPSHTIAFEGGDEECRISADRSRLERVALNLVSNAVKYSAKGTAIVLRVERCRDQAVLTVQDHGVGMSGEDLKLAFQSFGRGHGAHRMAQGTGLGLPIVKQIVEAHGGTIAIQSQPGEGTAVTVALPIIQGRPADSPPAGSTPAGG